MKKTNPQTTLKLVEASVLIAIIIVMAFTNIGYIRTAGLEITLIVVPVAVGAIILGEKYGALLGFVFGLTSFIQCFGLSAFGAALLNVSWIYTLIVCMVPRILMGYLCGLIFKGLKKIDKTKFFSFGVASFSAAFLNTALFMSTLYLFFGRSDFLHSVAENLGVSNSFFPLIFALVTMNGVIEAAVCTVFATAITKALSMRRVH